MNEQNAKIDGTHLGLEDHGIMTFFLYMDYGGSGQGFGGYSLDGKSGTIGHGKSILAIRRILEVIGVTKWEDLKGKYCRVRRGERWNGTIKAIGHIVEDKWFDIEEHFK